MKIYQYDEQYIYTGVSRDIGVKDGAPLGWTRTPPPEIPAGSFALFSGAEGWRIIDARPPAPPEPVPEWVYMRQARRALQDAELLSAIQPAISALPEPARTTAQIEWDYSQKVFRNRGIVVDMAASLGISGEQLDALFITASKID